jgi:hypothetical protein
MLFDRLTKPRWTSATRALFAVATVLLIGPTGMVGCSPEPPPEVGSACESLADCRGDNNLVCQDQACTVVACELAGDCPTETTCIEQICQPRQCALPGSCQQGSRCWEGICVKDGCADKAGCASGEVCLGLPPVCTEPPQLCSDDRECPVGEGCNLQRRQCVKNCTEDRDCASADYCLDELCRQPCRDDIDCPGGRSCVEARCRELPDCSEHPACSGLRLYRNQTTCECVSCLQSSNCDLTGQEACTSSGQCIYCPQSGTSEADCAALGKVFVEGCCSDCRDDSECSSPQTPYCERGRCQSVPGVECIAQNDCESEMVCDRGRCVEPPSFANCQHQSDCPAGEACFADGVCHLESQTCGGCPGPSRCVAERADEIGTCAGCTTACDQAACPDGQICFVSSDGTSSNDAEGFCVDSDSAPDCLP